MDDAKYISEKVRAAISVLRDAADDAERTLDMYKNEPLMQPSAVMHSMVWGLANSYSNIQAALNHISRTLHGQLTSKKD